MTSRNIAFIGKSGSGTSTVAANVAAALAEAGRRVTLIGCGPRADATANLRGGRPVQSLHDALQAGPGPRPDRLVVAGFKGVRCLEIGAPVAGGCRGRIFRDALDLVSRLRLLDEPCPDFVLLDVPGDSSCDGLTTLLQSGLAHQAVLVTRADFAALRTVNELLGTLATLSAAAPQLAGMVGNDLAGPFAEAVIDDFAVWTGTEVLARLPRSPVVMQSDLQGETVIESSPLALHAYAWRRLARKLVDLEGDRRPRPLDGAALKAWAAQWAERIYELDGGFIREGEAI